MKPRFRNFVLLGASSDIGQSLLLELISRADSNVIATSRSRSSGSAKKHGRHKQRPNWLDGIDLTREESLSRLTRQIAKRFAEPFVVIHSVGDYWVHKRLVDTSLLEIETMVQSHVVTLLNVARYLTPIMIRNGGGRMIAFSCNSTTYNYPDMAPFTCSKAAVESFVRSFAHEYADAGISAFAVALPTILTEKVKKDKPNGDHANYITPAELANYVVHYIAQCPYLASGTTQRLFRHSPSFYGASYYSRNPRKLGTTSNS